MPDAPFTPLDGRARVAIVFLAVVAVFEGLTIVSDLLTLGTIDDYATGAASYDDLVASDNRNAALAVIVAAGTLVAAIFFIRWFHAAYRNLRELNGWPPQFDNGWAIGAWFVPLLNLWRPKQMADEIRRSGEPPKGPPSGARSSGAALVGIWWAFWIGSLVASIIANANDGSDSRHALHLDVAWSAIDLVAAILAVLVVRQLTTGQEQRHRGVVAGQTALPV